MPKDNMSHQFAIAGHLLGQSAKESKWTNLGYWQQDSDYVSACEHLAAQIGQAAGLNAATHVLELACRAGASLDFWHTHFGVQRIYALELQENLVEDIIKQQPAHIKMISQGRFDVLPLPTALARQLAQQPVDAVVCVDAAYHAQSLQHFLAVAKYGLKSGGHLAFSTLSLATTWQQAGFWQQYMHQRLLKLADIPMLSVLPEHIIRQQLGAMGFINIRIETMDAAVLLGFSRYVATRTKQLKPSQRLNAAWLKIVMTARLCHYLHQHRLIHYTLISAQLA